MTNLQQVKVEVVNSQKDLNSIYSQKRFQEVEFDLSQKAKVITERESQVKIRENQLMEKEKELIEKENKNSQKEKEIQEKESY